MPVVLVYLTGLLNTRHRIAHEHLVSPRLRNAVRERAMTVIRAHAEA